MLTDTGALDDSYCLLSCAHFGPKIEAIEKLEAWLFLLNQIIPNVEIVRL